MKTVMCCWLFTILYLDLCRSKNDDCGESNKYANVTKMKTAQVSLTLMEQSKVDRTATNEDTNENASCDIFLGDSWFSSVELAVLARRIHDSDYVGIIKTNSGRCPKKFVEQKMKEWPGGSYLNLTTTIDGIELVVTGYKYCSSKVLTFVWTRGAGHTEPGDPYKAKWRDSNGNRCEQDVHRPSVISFYFN